MFLATYLIDNEIRISLFQYSCKARGIICKADDANISFLNGNDTIIGSSSNFFLSHGLMIDDVMKNLTSAAVLREKPVWLMDMECMSAMSFEEGESRAAASELHQSSMIQ